MIPLVFFPLWGRALVEGLLEACLLALVEVLPPSVMFGGRAAGIAPFSVVDDTVEKTGEGQFGDLFPIPSMQGVERMRADEGAVGNEDVQMGVVV